MKKVLTVLLAVAVVFTFSFGSAFAELNDTQKTELEDFVKAEYTNYYETIDKAASTYFGKLTFDEDGYLAAGEESATTVDTGYVAKSLVQDALNDAVKDAKTEFNAKIKAYVYGDGSSEIADKSAAMAQMAKDVNTVITKYIKDAAVITANWTDMLEDQLATEKDDAYATIAKYSADSYSAKKDDWSQVISANDSTKDYGEVYEYAAGKFTKTTPAEYQYSSKALTGLTAGDEYAAKAFVKALLDTQRDIVTNADNKDSADQTKASIDTVRAAKDAVTDVLAGHKLKSTAAYYVEAIPTLSDMKDNTSLTDKKANAIAVITSKIAAKQVEMSEDLQDMIDALDKQSKLSKDDEKTLKKLKELKASLADDFAKVKEVYVADINNAVTTEKVNNLKTKYDAEIAKYTATTATKDGYEKGASVADLKTGDLFKKYDNIVDAAADLKADAELMKIQKDVNGQAYYDADQLADSLEDVLEDLYAGSKYMKADGITVDYDLAKADLTRGNEWFLLNTKKNYIDLIEGEAEDRTVASWHYKDIDGNDVTEAWEKATAANAATPSITELKSGKQSTAGYTFKPKNMYDDAQKAELETLVKETKEAITAAKTVAEIESIFKAAHEKYEDIDTTVDLASNWNGKIGVAYKNAKYDQELKAYADYFVGKATAKDYAVTLDAEEILDKVAYPVMMEAYTSDQLAAKVAEAKAAIDAIKTEKQLKEEKNAVEDLIKALPTTISLADKDAIKAASDALDDLRDEYGYDATLEPLNANNVETAVKAYEKLAREAIEDAYDDLDKKITVDDDAAIKALRDALEDYDTFCNDYVKTSYSFENLVLDYDAWDAKIKVLENDLSTAKEKAAKELMAKLPSNPTEKDRAQVEAARAAYEALTLEEKLEVVGTLQYKNLIDAEEALGLNVGKSVKELKITASSTAKKGSITVKWTAKGDASAVDGYEIWKSKKHSSGYKKAFTTKKQTYKNTKGLKKGTRYYYKVRAYKMVDGKKITSDWSNKARRVAK